MMLLMSESIVHMEINQQQCKLGNQFEENNKYIPMIILKTSKLEGKEVSILQVMIT